MNILRPWNGGIFSSKHGEDSAEHDPLVPHPISKNRVRIVCIYRFIDDLWRELRYNQA
jgi:hypothetical protein